ncbi:XF1762 family protein [Sphingobium yanoikuyae]|uniref:XF1762 family protein n=1 Tax=Sphingobium yanoikuyae TaxID=13690 RepID=UPI0028B1FD13|nr:XF1762 family protein [Sphingobium yanoikuyae]
MRLTLRPIIQREAFAFVERHHRHHPPPRGDLWRHAVVTEDGALAGVAIVGRPVARALNDGFTCEVVRLCTLDAPNANSMLYAASERTARAQEYRRGLTYLLASEWDRFDPDTGRRIGGAGCRAAGWRELWRVPGRSWNTPSRPRIDRHPTSDKVAIGWGEWKNIA